jgi:hypothetical protein
VDWLVEISYTAADHQPRQQALELRLYGPDATDPDTALRRARDRHLLAEHAIAPQNITDIRAVLIDKELNP